jgi:hypothetical protein
VATGLIVATEREEQMSASPSCAIPAGTAHALDPTTGRTLCGRDGTDHVPWPELTWPPLGMAAVDACPLCVAG